MSESKTGHTLPKDTILDERYVIIRKIGEGGMGEVYLALDKRTSREVAVKLLRTALANDDIDQKRFIQESKICAKIRHENVVEVIDAFCHEGFPCFAMEYVDGHSLRTLFDQKQSWKTTVPVLIDTLDAIHAAHELGILHRDLKPSNIFISRDGTVKVGDWGIAKITNDTTGMTKTGMILGTPHYLAPERIVDGTSFTQSDIYAVGCMLHEAVSGSPPFLGKLCDVVNSQIFKIPTIPPHTPEELKKFMLKLLVKDVQKRPSNALKVQEELSAIYEKILSVDPNNEEDLDASGFSTYKLNKSGLSPNATRHNIGRSKAVKTEKIQSNKSCIQKSVLNKSAIRKSAINKSAIIPVSNAGKGSEKSSVKRMSFALILLALCAFIIYSTVLREDQSEKIPMEKLLSRAYAVDFEAIELRYDSRLKSKFTFKMFKITQSAETEDQNIFLEGTINFNDPLLSSGRTNSIRISLPAPCYRDISLHIGEAPPKIFKIDMNPIYMEGFKPIIEIENNTLQTLSQKLSLLRGIHEMDDKKPFIEAIEEKGLTKKVLDRLEVIVPQYLSYINYSTSPYSDEAEVLTTLRKLSPFLAQGDIHPLFGLASKKWGSSTRRSTSYPKQVIGS